MFCTAGKRLRGGNCVDLPSIMDMTGRHGFCGFWFGFRTVSAFRGGSRIGLWWAPIVAEVVRERDACAIAFRGRAT